jgi:hypothetical protein
VISSCFELSITCPQRAPKRNKKEQSSRCTAGSIAWSSLLLRLLLLLLQLTLHQSCDAAHLPDSPAEELQWDGEPAHRAQTC